MYVCTYVCKYVRSVSKYVCMYVRMYCMYLCMYVCMHTYIYIYIYTYSMHTYMYVCLYVCMYVCIFDPEVQWDCSWSTSFVDNAPSESPGAALPAEELSFTFGTLDSWTLKLLVRQAQLICMNARADCENCMVIMFDFSGHSSASRHILGSSILCLALPTNHG